MDQFDGALLVKAGCQDRRSQFHKGGVADPPLSLRGVARKAAPQTVIVELQSRRCPIEPVHTGQFGGRRPKLFRDPLAADARGTSGLQAIGQ